MAPVKLTEINISQRRSDNSKERWGDVCWSESSRCFCVIHYAWIDGWIDWQEAAMIKCWAKRKMLHISGSKRSVKMANFPRGSHKSFRQIIWRRFWIFPTYTSDVDLIEKSFMSMEYVFISPPSTQLLSFFHSNALSLNNLIEMAQLQL